MIQSIWDSIIYVMSDAYFWPAMGIIVMMGLFVGSTLYDGCIKEVKKMVISLSIYALMIIAVTSSRVVPLFFDNRFIKHHPFSGIATVLLVTIFYLLGIWIGVKVTNHVHKGKEI